LPFNYTSIDLPVREIVPEVKELLLRQQTLIVNAPPGAGKSTLLPLTLLDEPWLTGKKIILLEPRRLAAKSVATRMAQLLGEQPGETIGYRIRFESRSSAATRLEVVTEGILTRMLHHDNALEGVGLVLFDEFHERSIHADVALALCREAQQILRPDLRIVIMSATLNMPALAALLQAPVVVSEGRQYPVDVIYSGAADMRLLPELTTRQVLEATRVHDGDTLVFLPGEAEIRQCAELLRKELPQFFIHPLYGMLPWGEQQAAILPHKNGKRKIVLATSIAETSLTIEGIRIVIDTGFSRVSRFDPKSGLSRLETVQISKDSADQRAGRAGRLSAGVCYRMWTKATHDRLAEHRIPEIAEADLAPLLLDLVRWGITDASTLTWLTSPPKANLAQANELLHQLNAMEYGKITEHGKAIHQLGCHPRIAHMLIKAKEDNSVPLAADLAAILEERDPLPKDSGIDINLRIEALRRSRSNGGTGQRFGRIEKAAESYRQLLNASVDNGPVDPYETGLLLAYAYPERIACARVGNNAQFQLANGKIAAAGHKDDLAHEPWLAVAHMDARDGLGKIFLAAPLNPKDLLPLVKEREVITWDTRKGGIVASKDLRIGNIVLRSQPLTQPDETLMLKAVSEALRTEGEQLLQWDEKMTNLQHRILSLRHWNPYEQWPDVSTRSLLQNNLQWIEPYLTGVKKADDLKKIPLAQALTQSLTWEQQQQLELLAPERIKVPTGSGISLQYFATGDTPVLAVRLQEVFGMEDTPAINQGKTKVVMHLLSPGYKPVQVTSDLRSFWNNTYFEVKKELQRRYPKHAWPDDPWTAPPVAKGRSMK
jgi:ATP-dependent helicase HrpB